MKYLLIGLLSLFMFSCSHNIPIANLEFVKIEKNNKYKNSFFLYFSSDIELIGNLEKNHDAQYLECFFKKMDINMNNFFDYKGYSLNSVMGLILISKTSNKYTYKIKTSFEDKNSNLGGIEESERVMKGVTKFMTKDNINCLSCIFTASAFMNTTSRYISNTMCLPKEEIKKVMK